MFPASRSVLPLSSRGLCFGVTGLRLSLLDKAIMLLEIPTSFHPKFHYLFVLPQITKWIGVNSLTGPLKNPRIVFQIQNVKYCSDGMSAHLPTASFRIQAYNKYNGTELRNARCFSGSFVNSSTWTSVTFTLHSRDYTCSKSDLTAKKCLQICMSPRFTHTAKKKIKMDTPFIEGAGASGIFRLGKSGFHYTCMSKYIKQQE